MTHAPGENDDRAGAGEPAVSRAALGTLGGAPGDGARHRGLALFLVSAAQFVLQLDFSIVNVALATIQREFGVAPADLQWIVTGYALPFGSLLLPASATCSGTGGCSRPGWSSSG